MNLNALRYFLEVAKCQSIRRASERLHVAASAISRQISSLEHQLNCTLLERRSDGVTLTEAGKRLHAHGLKIDAQLQLVQSDIDELRFLQRGIVRIATVEGITEHFLPKVMSTFLKKYPNVSFDVSVLSRDETVDALDRYECDIGFLYDYQHHHAVDIIANYHQPLHAFVPPGHKLARGERLKLAQLLTFDHVMPSIDFGINQLVTRVAKQYKTQVSPKIVSNRLHFLSAYAKLNDAVIFMPVQAVYSDVEYGKLIPINLDCAPFKNRHLSLATRKQRVLSSAASLFADHAQEQFSYWESLDKGILESAEASWLDSELKESRP
ncbi:LysR family transcriptional regulator [Leucothrix sargassi]|nr:LysR family transcriptional regulator [Leucothrix sargassi]